ncbi:MAG: trehalose-phosphatase [Gemmatimonadota bacterium]|nr:trehalose-phosphatase [Gemmatimonadota bacterium]
MDRRPDVRRSGARVGKPPPASMEWAWFFDIDGTLVEIASLPSRIIVHDELLRAIARLHVLTGGAVSLITGRAISDVDRIFDLPEISVAGQHGLELRVAGGNITSHPVPEEALRLLRDELSSSIAGRPGLVAEFKGMSIALHYRMAPALAGYSHTLLRSLGAKYAPDFVIQKGKRVVELKPVGADKGEVIRRLMTTDPFAGRTPVFVGDDLTDEAGFAIVNEMAGHSIKVGSGPTCARFRLTTVSQVRRWLAEGTEREESIGYPGSEHQ